MPNGWILILEDPEVSQQWNIICGQPGLRIEGPIRESVPEGCIGLLSVHSQLFVLMPCTGSVTSLLPSQGEACGCMDHKGDMDQSEEQGTSSWVTLTPVSFLAHTRHSA